MSGGNDWLEEGDGSMDGEQRSPLSELADEVRKRSQQGTPDTPEETFTKQPFLELSDDELWSSVDEERSSPAVRSHDGLQQKRTDEYVVPKRDFCQSCQYFDEPPRVQCNHPGTEIMEFIDMEHVRVSNCPVVRDRVDMED